MHSLNRHPHQQQPCLDCELPTQERLNYFTGQFLLERDLRTEQEYHIAKHRQHNRYLHGHGTVCGLRVTEHPNPACRDRFVVLEPGLALDCCGREIVVQEPVYFDLVAALASQKADPTITGKHLLLSLCYAECKTEFVPALYAECGCTDTGYEANRIYEGFEIEAKLVDDDKLPKPQVVDPSGVQLEWTTTLTTDKALRVAIDPKQTRIYVLNAATPNQIMVYDTEHYCLLKSIPFIAGDGRIVDLAVSSNGNFLYVFRYVETTPAAGATPGSGNYFLRVIQVKDTTTGDDLNPVQPIASGDASQDIPLTAGSEATPPRLAVGSKDTSGKVVTLDLNATPNKKITVWTDRINAIGANSALAVGDPDSPKYYEGDVGDGRAIAISPDGSWLFIAEAGGTATSNVVQVFNIGTRKVIHSIPIPVGETASLLEVSGDSLWLYVITDAKKAYVFRIQETPTLFPAVNTTGVDLGTDTLIALQVSPTGKWGYVLLQGASDATKGWVKVISRDKLDDPGQAVSGAIAVTATPHDLALATDGQRLYAAGEGAAKACGGVSVLNISEDQCKDLFWRSLEHCPECVEACIPLAVVKDYAIDAVVTDARINNRIRPLVPSTETLQQLILCALNSASKPASPATGAGVKSADAVTIAATLPAAADFDPVTGNIHFQIPAGAKGRDGTNGAPGDPGINGVNGVGLEPDLTQIEALSWIHDTGDNPIASIVRLSGQKSQGLVIAFTRPVLVADSANPFAPPNQMDAEHIFQVLVEHELEQRRAIGISCRCAVIGRVVAVEEFGFDAAGRIISAREVPRPMAKGAAFIFGSKQFEQLQDLIAWGLTIRLHGDFVLDEKRKAIDAEFVRATLPTGDRPAGAPVGVQGGLFESWFWLKEKPKPKEPV